MDAVLFLRGFYLVVAATVPSIQDLDLDCLLKFAL